MRKIFFAVAMAFMLLLVSCDFSIGTYYPDSEKMAANLRESGYSVIVNDDIGKSKGIHLSAENGSEFIEFYWLDSGIEVKELTEKMKERHSSYYTCIYMTGDDTYGTIAYISSRKARSDAGIHTKGQR